MATIDSSGFATSVATGTTTISAVYSGLTATAPLTITTASLVSVSISPSSASIAKGLTQLFTATGHYSDASDQDVTLSAAWSSSNNLVSTISATGLASSVDQGTTTISAVYSGKTATALLTVTPAVPARIDVTPINPILRLNATQQFTATKVSTDGTTQNVTNLVDWTTSDPAIATITSGGLAAPVNMGTATISAADAGSELTGTTLVIVRAFVTLPDTGQTQGYSDTFGEDADYLINAPSYLDNSDGTIMDQHTELLWQQQDDGVTKKWPDAATYCQNLNLVGTGWRLPTRRELMTILDLGVSVPKINGTFFLDTKTTLYWSSDPIGASNALVVDFDTGRLLQSWVENPGYVRCVRGTQLIPSIFSNNNDGTIIDYATGLMWQQGENSSMLWDDALLTCENLSFAGHDDWRLPDAKELESLIYGTGSPSIDISFFPGALSSFYWTSTSCSLSQSYVVNFSDRTSSCIDKAITPSYVRCVRGGH